MGSLDLKELNILFMLFTVITNANSGVECFVADPIHDEMEEYVIFSDTDWHISDRDDDRTEFPAALSPGNPSMPEWNYTQNFVTKNPVSPVVVKAVLIETHPKTRKSYSTDKTNRKFNNIVYYY